MKNNESSRAMSKVVERIFRGLNIAGLKVEDENGFVKFFLNIINRFFNFSISLEELAYLYFRLPVERLDELQKHLDNIGSNFVYWKVFYNNHKDRAQEIINMACHEMLKRATSFNQLEILNALPIDKEIKNEISAAMRGIRLADNVSFCEKFRTITPETELTKPEWLALLNDAFCSFEHLEKLSRLPQIPIRIKNLAITAMIGLSENKFSKIMRIYRLIKPSSRLRNKVVVIINQLEIDRNELIRVYNEEKYWTSLKRCLWQKIEDTDWRPEECAKFIVKYASDTRLRKIMLVNMDFSQLKNTIYAVENNLPAKKAIMLVMVRRLENDIQEKTLKKIATINKLPKVISMIDARRNSRFYSDERLSIINPQTSLALAAN